MNMPTLVRKLKQFQVCDCRIDRHCLDYLKELQLVAYGVDGHRRVLNGLRAIQECPCYFATHCIEKLCELEQALASSVETEAAVQA